MNNINEVSCFYLVSYLSGCFFTSGNKAHCCLNLQKLRELTQQGESPRCKTYKISCFKMYCKIANISKLSDHYNVVLGVTYEALPMSSRTGDNKHKTIFFNLKIRCYWRTLTHLRDKFATQKGVRIIIIMLKLSSCNWPQYQCSKCGVHEQWLSVKYKPNVSVMSSAK